jgi:hypothetical protein
MQELRRYYKSGLFILLTLAAIATPYFQSASVDYVRTMKGPDWAAKVAGIAVSTLAFLLLLPIGEYIVRRLAWRVMLRAFDVNGRWRGISTYTDVRVGQAKVPFSSEHELLIEQDCLGLSIRPAEGQHYISWESLAISQPDKYTLRYAYLVKYENNSGFPGEAIGYEETRVMKRCWGRPTMMKGVFFHCARGQEPVYSGRVVYRRM